jgi:hypothetical protein
MNDVPKDRLAELVAVAQRLQQLLAGEAPGMVAARVAVAADKAACTLGRLADLAGPGGKPKG